MIHMFLSSSIYCYFLQYKMRIKRNKLHFHFQTLGLIEKWPILRWGAVPCDRCSLLVALQVTPNCLVPPLHIPSCDRLLLFMNLRKKSGLFYFLVWVGVTSKWQPEIACSSSRDEAATALLVAVTATVVISFNKRTYLNSLGIFM
jgi:hypothetical protein